MQFNRAQLQDLVAARFEKSIRGPETFFAANVEIISKACWAMALRFKQGVPLPLMRTMFLWNLCIRPLWENELCPHWRYAMTVLLSLVPCKTIMRANPILPTS